MNSIAQNLPRAYPQPQTLVERTAQQQDRVQANNGSAETIIDVEWQPVHELYAANASVQTVSTPLEPAADVRDASISAGVASDRYANMSPLTPPSPGSLLDIHV